MSSHPDEYASRSQSSTESCQLVYGQRSSGRASLHFPSLIIKKQKNHLKHCIGFNIYVYDKSIYLSSLGSTPVGMEYTLCIQFQSPMLFTVVLSAPHHQPFLLVRAWDRHRYHFFSSCGGVFGVYMKQES